MQMHCSNCGPVLVSSPIFGAQRLSISQSQFSCPNCGRPIGVRHAVYEFEKQVFSILWDSDLNRSQVRRFAKKVEKTVDPATLLEQSAAINPGLAKAVGLALEQPNTKLAIKIVGGIALFLLGVATDISDLDDAWDKYHRGELFESQSQDAEVPENDARHDAKPVPNATHPSKRK